MKQRLISSGLAAADFIHGHPRQITAVIATLLLAGAGGAWAVASLAPAAPKIPVHLVADPVQSAEPSTSLVPEPMVLFRSEPIRGTDSPESLLRRLGVADPAASHFLRHDKVAWNALFSRAAIGREVTAQLGPDNGLLRLEMRWLDTDSKPQVRRLRVLQTESGLVSEVDSFQPVPVQRMASGTVHKSMVAAATEAGLPGAVTDQFVELFRGQVNFRRGLQPGDEFSVIYEAYESGGEQLGAGRILSAEISNKGKLHRKVWFEGGKVIPAGYYSPGKLTTDRTEFIQPLARMRQTSAFGYRVHPVTRVGHGHSGTDFGAPHGTPIRVVTDGVVEFAGSQRGYGNVVYVKHEGGKYSTVYAHMSRIDVISGERVQQGQRLGAVGSTGMATGPHLHFEYRDAHGTPRDPVPVLAAHQRIPVPDELQQRFDSLVQAMDEKLALAQRTQPGSFQ